MQLHPLTAVQSVDDHIVRHAYVTSRVLLKRSDSAPAIQRCKAKDRTQSNLQLEIQIRDVKPVVFYTNEQ